MRSLQPSANYASKTRQSVSAEAYGEWNKKKEFKAPVRKRPCRFLPSRQTNTQKPPAFRQRTRGCQVSLDEFLGPSQDARAEGAHSENPRQFFSLLGKKNPPKLAEWRRVSLACMREEKRKDGIEACAAVLQSLDVEDLEVVLGAFSEESISKGTVFIEQGADGFKMFLIEAGEAAVYKRQTGPEASSGADALSTETSHTNDSKRADEENREAQQAGAELSEAERALLAEGFKKVNLMRAGDAVGELALMYNAPRAATVVAATDLKLWALDRETFGHIVRDAAARQRAMFEDALREVRVRLLREERRRPEETQLVCREV